MRWNFNLLFKRLDRNFFKGEISSFCMRDRRHLLHIEDKVSFNNEYCCPPHWLPHVLPFVDELVKDESCHIHRSRLRMEHHRVYCRLLKCEHYKDMIKWYGELMRR